MMMNQALIFNHENIGFRTDDLEDFLRTHRMNISLPRCRDVPDLELPDKLTKTTKVQEHTVNIPNSLTCSQPGVYYSGRLNKDKILFEYNPSVVNGDYVELQRARKEVIALTDSLARVISDRDAVQAGLKEALDWRDGADRDIKAQATKHIAELTDLRAKLQEAQYARQAAEKLAAQLGAEVDTLKAADPADLPDELDCALMALRAVQNGYGKESTQKKRIKEWLINHRSDLKPDAMERIATVANPDKATGRK